MMALRSIVFGAVVSCVFLSSAVRSDAASLTITIDGLRNNNGKVFLCVFSASTSDQAKFPDCESGRPVRTAKAIIAANKVVLTYNDLADGIYAVAMVHDENGNGKFDTNVIGIPTEGFGVSNNPSLYGSPKFDDAKFQLSGALSIKINPRYVL